VDNAPWLATSATGIGSLPGVDPVEAARIVVGELPELPHLPELPARGVGADLIGRTAGLLVDLAVEVAPSGYRVTAHRGRDHRRAVDLLRFDLDAFGEAVERAGTGPGVVKVQLAGPWTLTAQLELARGHRVLTDSGALREFTESLSEGLTAHVAEVAKRTGARVVVQLDEPVLPAVLTGLLPTPSKLGTVAAVPESEAREVLATVLDSARTASGQPVIVHCCAKRPPFALLRAAGADAVAFDLTVLWNASTPVLDEIGEGWEAGMTLFLGLVPPTGSEPLPSVKDAARPAFELVDRLGFARSLLADRAVPTPCCGLAGASQGRVRGVLSLVRDLGRAFVEPPEGW